MQEELKSFLQLFNFQFYKVNKIFSKILSAEVMRTAATDGSSNETGHSSVLSLKSLSDFLFILQLRISQVLLQLHKKSHQSKKKVQKGMLTVLEK